MLRSGDQIGPYTLINKLGRGAFGTVWLSERRTTIATTTAALKIPLDDDVDLETIKHEANLWVRACGHPNVLPIIEANIYDNQVIIASEYAPDGSLESWLKQHGKAPTVEAAVEIISGVLAGLEHLHARNIIHRDLKPANILFQGSTPRIADFGISRVLKSTSQSSSVAGTPAYMAPEAFDGKRNEQTDIWSVGVIFYQLLAGRLPFPQADITSLVGAILSRNPDPLPISVPAPLREVIGRALSKDTSQRSKSAAEMRAALRNPSAPNLDDSEATVIRGIPPTEILSSHPAQGEDTIELKYYYGADSITRWGSGSITTTWNHIFRSMAPFMMTPSEVWNIEAQLRAEIMESLKAQQIDPGGDTGFRLSDDTRNNIKIEFVALNLIKLGVTQHGHETWALTDGGLRRLLETRRK